MIGAPRQFKTADVEWPLIVVRSEQGTRRHILSEHPNVNGSWEVYCNHKVNWSPETCEDEPAEFCSRCLEGARNRLEQKGLGSWNTQLYWFLTQTLGMEITLPLFVPEAG